jgi:hypothetical protein
LLSGSKSHILGVGSSEFIKTHCENGHGRNVKKGQNRIFFDNIDQKPSETLKTALKSSSSNREKLRKKSIFTKTDFEFGTISPLPP